MRLLPRFELSGTQLIATALAAITATVAASFLGVTGTVIGAALASVVSAIGTAVYSHSLRTTHARVRDAVPSRRRGIEPRGANSAAGRPAPDHDAGESKPASRAERPSRWHAVAIGSLALFVAILTLVTGVELVTGRPLSDLVRGDTGSGTTVFGTTRNAAAEEPAPAPTVTQTVTPSVVVVTPTVTRTAPAVTRTTTPTVTSTPAPTASPTGTAPATSSAPPASGNPTP
jgi:hypothetical protein